MITLPFDTLVTLGFAGMAYLIVLAAVILAIAFAGVRK